MRLGLAFALLALLSNGAWAQGADWAPERNVELIVGTEAGGSADRLARVIQDVIQKEKLIPTTMTVVNKPGQGARVAISYLNGHEDDGHYLMLATASTVTTAILTGSMQLQDEMTPIAKLVDTDLVFFVKKDSPIQSMTDVVERLKADPGSVSFAFSTAAGNSNHIAIAKLAALSGVDPTKLRLVVNNAGSLVGPQVAGGHVDVGLSSTGSALPLVDAGELRWIGVPGHERLPGLPDVPTLAEQGLEVFPSVWTSVFGPKGLSNEQISYWEGILTKVMASEEAKEFVANSRWTVSFIPAKDFPVMLSAEWQSLRDSLVQLGMVK